MEKPRQENCAINRFPAIVFCVFSCAFGCTPRDAAPDLIRVSLDERPTPESLGFAGPMAPDCATARDKLVVIEFGDESVEFSAEPVDVQLSTFGDIVSTFRVERLESSRDDAAATAKKLVTVLPFPEGSVSHFERWRVDSRSDKVIVNSDVGETMYSVTVRQAPLDSPDWYVIFSVGWIDKNLLPKP